MVVFLNPATEGALFRGRKLLRRIELVAIPEGDDRRSLDVLARYDLPNLAIEGVTSLIRTAVAECYARDVSPGRARRLPVGDGRRRAACLFVAGNQYGDAGGAW